MKKKSIALVITGVLAIGSLTGFAYAQSTDLFNKNVKSEKQVMDKNIYKDMIKIMKENGYKDAAKAIEKNDYKAMDDFMNNMTDEDYNKMIDLMEENGYGTMAKMMSSISREEMLQMHNSMGGAEGCHSNTDSGNGMMGSF
ncbi:hypothetical protein [Sporosalibacterium faouarense]|uniref:hypothetical protein n=1 Tax=Sporosalibacterium faouarense TaxID=516123 RepID=UPI00192B4116|nr:hypothetical protein [Sporosalibacterium faouarense]